MLSFRAAAAPLILASAQENKHQVTDALQHYAVKGEVGVGHAVELRDETPNFTLHARQIQMTSNDFATTWSIYPVPRQGSTKATHLMSGVVKSLLVPLLG